MERSIPHGHVVVLVTRVLAGPTLKNQHIDFPATVEFIKPGKIPGGILVLQHSDLFPRVESPILKRKSMATPLGEDRSKTAKKAKLGESATLFVPAAFLQVIKLQACIFIQSGPM